MIKTTIPVVNKLGLHARAASKLVKLTAGFDSRLTLSANDQEVDAKSIMGILMLAATQGTELELVAEGPDEVLASAAIEALFLDCFGEGE